jgi:ankyrin repeat protein
MSGTLALSRDLHGAFVRGDVAAIRGFLGNPPDFPNTRTPLWLGDVLVYAIYWSPLATVRELLELGADPNSPTDDGFPPLIAATDRRPRADRDDRVEVIRLLLEYGADPNVRGLNDGTPLHQVVWKRAAWPAYLEAVSVLLAHGADPALKTRIDDCTSPIEDARAAGADVLVAVLRDGASGRHLG